MYTHKGSSDTRSVAPVLNVNFEDEMSENARHSLHTYATRWLGSEVCVYVRGSGCGCGCLCTLDTDALQMQTNDQQMTIPVIVSSQRPHPTPHRWQYISDCVCTIHQGRIEGGGS